MTSLAEIMDWSNHIRILIPRPVKDSVARSLGMYLQDYDEQRPLHEMRHLDQLPNLNEFPGCE